MPRTEAAIPDRRKAILTEHWAGRHCLSNLSENVGTTSRAGAVGPTSSTNNLSWDLRQTDVTNYPR